MGAHYYDPQVGLFLTRDTYLEQKPYLYCEHDPVNRVDPTGHEWDFWGWLGQKVGLDFNFNRDDWNKIADGIDWFGNAYIWIGSGGSIGGSVGWGSPHPRQNLPPPFTKPQYGWGLIDPDTRLYGRRLGVPNQAKLGGVVGAIGGGYFAAGIFCKGLAWLIHD